MANSLITLLPPTRSGKTFFLAGTLLGVAALGQLLVLAGYLIGGGAAAHRAGIAPTEAPSFRTPGPSAVASSTPGPVLAPPTPAPAVPVETPAVAALTRPTPAPALRLQNPPTDLLEQARQLRSRGDMNSALARLREAQVAEPDSPQIIAEMALTYEAMQIPDRAFEQWQRLYGLGEGVGALYKMAELKLRSVPSTVASDPPPASPVAGTLPSGEPNVFGGQGDAVLKLTDIHMEALPDPVVEQKIALKIVVKNRPGTAIDPNKVRILTYFYDLVDGKDVVQTNAQTDYTWLTPGRIDWANDKSEVLQTTYTRPKAAPEAVPTPTPDTASKKGRRTKSGAPPPPATPAPPVRTYLGYAVQLYYDRQLQDVQADPVRLLQQFPAPLTLAAE